MAPAQTVHTLQQPCLCSQIVAATPWSRASPTDWLELRTVIYVTDIGDTEQVGRAHREVFADVRPATTMIQVSALIRPEMRVEIEAYAVIDEA